MNICEPIRLDGFQVMWRTVALVLIETVLGIGFGQTAHEGVSPHLCQYRGRGDRGAFRITFHDVHLALVYVEGIAVEQHDVGPYTCALYLLDRGAESPSERCRHAVSVDIGRRNVLDGESQRDFLDLRGYRLTTLGLYLLRIVQALYEGLSRQDNGPYGQRAGKRSPPHLVKADDDGIGAPTGKLALVKRPASKAKDKVAVLYLEGAITEDEGDGIVSKEVVKTLKKIQKDDDVRALVLRVNSPGGSADASEQIWHAIQNVKADNIPVVVSMGDYAASGGYYISCGADYIFAQPTTITGSIGIFGTIPNVAKLRDKVGLDIDGLSTNKHSALENNIIYKGMNPEERAMMQAMIERGYDLFTSRCAEGRHVSQDYIKSIGEGRVWLGFKGKEIGIVDELGNIDDAIAKAVELAHLENYQVAYYPDVVDPLEEMLKMFDNTTDEERLLLKVREFASKPRVLALMPEVTIQ